MSISIRNISKRFGTYQALDGICLDVAPGELVALLGPSGSGKTTLLRVIAGLERPNSGSVHFEGADITNQRVQERGVGFVFQHYALFRHMTIFENVAFGLRVRPRALRPGEPQAGPEDARAADTIDVVVAVDDDLAACADGGDDPVGRLDRARQAFRVVQAGQLRLEERRRPGRVVDPPIEQELRQQR